MVSVGAYYLLRGKHREFAMKSVKIGLIAATVAAAFTLATGHSSAEGVAKNQPEKMAAFEGQWDTQKRAPLTLAGWVDEKNEKTYALEIPGLLSLMAKGDIDAEMEGIRAKPKADRPPTNMSFQFYHIMIAVGFALIALSAWAAWALWRGRLEKSRFLLVCLTLSVLGPQIANQAGWFAAEVGRQPWIVYKLLRTSDALSKVVTANQVMASMVMFMTVYALLFAAFLYLLNDKIQHGPDETDLTPSGKHALPTKGGAL